MNYLCSSYSPSLPYRDDFQKSIESNMTEFFQERYGKGKSIDKMKFHKDAEFVEEQTEETHEFNKCRLVWLRVKLYGNQLSGVPGVRPY